MALVRSCFSPQPPLALFMQAILKYLFIQAGMLTLLLVLGDYFTLIRGSTPLFAWIASSAVLSEKVGHREKAQPWVPLHPGHAATAQEHRGVHHHPNQYLHCDDTVGESQPPTGLQSFIYRIEGR